MTVAELKKFLKKKDEKLLGNKKDLEKRFSKAYDIPKDVVDPLLYYKTREKVKKRVKTWPSAYASGQVVSEYKKAGGSYKGKKGEKDLSRWYEEHWVNVCEKSKSGKYLDCSSSESKKYPYCRPSVRVNSSTPKTVGEIGKKKIKEMCKKKKDSKRIYL